AIDIKLLSSETFQFCSGVQLFSLFDQGVPTFDWRDIDFDYAGIGRDLELREPRVAWWGIPFDLEREACDLACSLQSRAQLNISVCRMERREENMQNTVTRFNTERRFYDTESGFANDRRGTARW